MSPTAQACAEVMEYLRKKERVMSEIPIEVSPEYAWGMALYSLMSTAATIYEMSKSPDYRDLAVKDLGQISEAALAINLAWSQLKKREVA